MPAVVMHWLHLVSMFALIISGFYIHWPFIPGLMSLMRGLHIVFMWVLIIVAIARVIWAFVGRTSAHGSREVVRDYRHFGYQKENRGTLGPTLGYYLFLRKNPPAGAKFNPLQKVTYVTWLVLIVLQAITGLALWDPIQHVFMPLTYALGGLFYVRMIHFIIMWLFIITTLIHIYLSVLHPEAVRLMFLWREDPGPAGATTTTTERRTETVGSTTVTRPR
jgi:Ni/Fe-hydrogenase 1 B-type cytochrome subunit